MNNQSAQWEIIEVEKYRLQFFHPVMKYYRTNKTLDTSGYKVGDMITLRSKVTPNWSYPPKDHLDYEIVN